MFKKLEKRLILTGTIEAVTPLHIGSGRAEVEIGGMEMPVLVYPDGQPYIPGSSLKGRVRAEAERIARKEGMNPCTPPDVKNMCGSLKRSLDEFCICCKIFGTAGDISVASKVKFRDAPPVGKLEALVERIGIAIDREKGTVSKGAFYTIQAVPANTKFAFEIVAENLTDEELKLFLGALKSVEDSALGGSSTRGFGKIRFNIEKLVERTAGFYLGKESEKTFTGEQLKLWLKEKGGLQ